MEQVFSDYYESYIDEYDFDLAKPLYFKWMKNNNQTPEIKEEDGLFDLTAGQVDHVLYHAEMQGFTIPTRTDPQYAKGGEIDYVVVNESLFNENIRDLDLSGLRRGRGQNNAFIGDLEIELMDGSSWRTISGEFGENDYVDEYGFKIVNKSYAKGGEVEKEFWQEINKETFESYIDRLYRDGADDDSLLSGSIWVEFKQENLRDNLYDRLSAIDENVRWVGYSNSDVDKRATAREGSWWSIYISVENLTIPEIREMFLGDRNSYDTSFNETLAEKVAEDLEKKGIKAGELGFYTYGQTFDLEISSEREYNAMVYWEDDNGKTGEVEITEIYAKSEEEAEEKAREQFNDGASPSDADNPYVTYVSISDYGSYAKGGRTYLSYDRMSRSPFKSHTKQKLYEMGYTYDYLKGLSSIQAEKLLKQNSYAKGGLVKKSDFTMLGLGALGGILIGMLKK